MSSNDEYTPTTAMVEDAYVQAYGNRAPGVHEMSIAEFDRWLAAHDREVAAKALREFAKKVYNGAPASRDANFQAFYNDGLHPVLMAEADRIEKGEVDEPR